MKESSRMDLLDLGVVLAKRKKTILLILCISIILGVLIAFIWPKSYKSEVSFIVTDGNSVNFSSGGLLSGLANLSVNGSKLTADQVMELIRSKEIQNEVIAEFNLKEVYGTDIAEALRKKLGNSINIEEKREGGLGFNKIISITLSYIDRDPVRTNDLVKFYFQELDSKVEELNRQNVQDGYLLLKSRLNQNEIDLEIAEDSLVAYQERFGILEVEETAKAQVRGVAFLKAEIVKLEVQITYLKNALGENSSKVKDLELQKSGFEEKYNELLRGSDKSSKGVDIFESLTDMPSLFVEYLRRYREVIVQEEIYKVLYPQFEQQKLNFEEVNSGLRIIDPALLPTYKYSPKRAYIIIAAFMLGLFISLLTVFIKEWKASLEEENPEELHRFKSFYSALKSW